jgi:hypothetical protein
MEKEKETIANSVSISSPYSEMYHNISREPAYLRPYAIGNMRLLYGLRWRDIMNAIGSDSRFA